MHASVATDSLSSTTDLWNGRLARKTRTRAGIDPRRVAALGMILTVNTGLWLAIVHAVHVVA